jgi:hypothetical protein
MVTKLTYSTLGMNTYRKQSCCNTDNGPKQKRRITVFWGVTPCSLVNMWRNLSSPSSWQRGKTRKEMRLQICWTEGYEQSNWRQWPWRVWGHTAYGATWHTWSAGAPQSWHLVRLQLSHPWGYQQSSYLLTWQSQILQEQSDWTNNLRFNGPCIIVIAEE